MTLWKGTQDQQPWAYVTGKHPDKALPYTGLAYMAGVIDLGDSGSMPNYNFEVAGKLLDTGDGVDVNPADYIRYVLDKVGLSKVEIIGLDNYRKYCAAADLLISTPPDETQSKSARDIINEIATLTNAYVFWSNDTFKIVPLDDRTYAEWTPNRTILYNLTADDFIPQSGGALVTYQRKDSSEVYNQFPVEFINRANGYEKETVSYAVTDDIVDYGLRQASTTQAHYFYTKERAVKLAESLARNGKYSRNKYTFKLDWSFCRLEVGDLVTLTDVNCGLNKQVVLIDSVTEGTDGLLTFTAISRPDGKYSEATYDVHETDRPYINYNQPAPDTAKPVILQPPADLTQNGLELWIGAKGTADMWGGCDVFVSDDNEHYRLAGQITNTARIGTLAAAVAKDATTIEVAVNGTLLSGSEQDAQRGNTLCWLDGECLSYQTANLLTNGHWQLTGCIRGQYNTSAVTHAAGVPFARLDATLLHVPFRKEDVGKKTWLKFASYNIFGSGNQSLADVKAYEYTIMAYYIPPVSDLRVYNRYRQMPDGVVRYDLVVSWTPPELQSYLSGEVWYKTDHQQVQNVTIKEGTAADKAGFDGEWIFGGSGKNQVVIPQAVVGDVYRICVCTKDEWGASTSPDTAPSVDILVAMRTEIPNTPDNVLITFGTASVVSWKEVTNTDVAFYEIRTDQYPGRETDAMLARTTDTSCTVSLSTRTGKLYVYVKSAVGKYSAPAIITYNKPVPVKPDAPVVTPKLGGLSIVAQSVPTDCIGVKYYINSAVISSVNNQLAYTCDAGIYDVTVAFYDLFGVGPQSPATRCVVKALVDSSLLADQAVTRQKVDQVIDKAVQDTQTTLPQQIQAAAASAANDLSAVITELNKAPGDSSYKSISDLKTTTDGLTSTFATQKASQDKVNSSVDTQISQIKQDASTLSSTVSANKASQDKVNSSLTSKITQTSDAVTTVVSNLNDSTKAQSYSAIAQMSNAIATKITQGDMTSYLQQDHTGFYIKGSLVNIDGTTKIGNNIITNNMIQSNAVTADKINVNSLSAITATIGTLRTKASGGRMEIHDNLILIYDNNNVLRVRMGVW